MVVRTTVVRVTANGQNCSANGPAAGADYVFEVEEEDDGRVYVFMRGSRTGPYKSERDALAAGMREAREIIRARIA